MQTNHIGRKLYRWRVEHDLTLREVAEALGVSEVTVHRWERGKAEPREGKRLKIRRLLARKSGAGRPEGVKR